MSQTTDGRRVTAADNDEVAVEGAVGDRAVRFQACLEGEVPAEPFRGGRHREQLHVRRRHHELLAVARIHDAPIAQGFDVGKFDIVIAANVLHATSDLGRSVANVRDLLKPTGVLLLIEGTRRVRWLDLIFGMTPGWWAYRDRNLRPDYPLISVGQWKSLLDVEYGLNADGGGGCFSRDRRPLGYTLQTAEKTYADYAFTTHNPGGHSSKPRPDNAIYELSADESSALGTLMAEVMRAQREALGAEHVYAFQIADQVQHCHVHLVPRFADTPDRLRGTRCFDARPEDALPDSELVRAAEAVGRKLAP